MQKMYMKFVLKNLLKIYQKSSRKLFSWICGHLECTHDLHAVQLMPLSPHHLLLH